MEESNSSRRELLKKTFLAGGSLSLLSGKSLLGSLRDACGLTPPQTEGPFYPDADQTDKDWDLTQLKGHNQRAKGQVVYISGTVMDASCRVIPNALVEIWQAAFSGRYNHGGDTSGLEIDPHFQYWGRANSDVDGKYNFKTIIPGHYPANQTWIRPPHIHYKAFAVGFEDLTTQMYFDALSFPSDKQQLISNLNAKDSILQKVPASQRKDVIIRFKASGIGFEAGSLTGNFDIVMEKI